MRKVRLADAVHAGRKTPLEKTPHKTRYINDHRLEVAPPPQRRRLDRRIIKSTEDRRGISY